MESAIRHGPPQHILAHHMAIAGFRSAMASNVGNPILLAMLASGKRRKPYLTPTFVFAVLKLICVRPASRAAGTNVFTDYIRI